MILGALSLGSLKKFHPPQKNTKKMVNYLQVVQSGVSMLLTIIIGYVVNKFRLLPSEAMDNINRYLLQLCYLPMIMRVIAKNDIKHVSIMPFVVGVCANLTTQLFLLILFLVPLRKKKKNTPSHGNNLPLDVHENLVSSENNNNSPRYNVKPPRDYLRNFKLYLSCVLPSVYINYLIVGFPIFNAIWPENENVMITVICLSNDMISVPIYLLLSNIYNNKKENRKHKEANDGQEEKFSMKVFITIGKKIVTNPILIGIVLGFVYSATGWDLCLFLDNFLGTWGNSVLALCLYCVGGFLSQHSLIACNIFEFIFSVIARHVIMPGFMALYSYLFHLGGRLSKQCVIMGCLPSATACYVLSINSKIGPGLSSTMIFWTTIFCVPFTLLWLLCFDKLKFFGDD